jgi:hypothetical protein
MKFNVMHNSLSAIGECQEEDEVKLLYPQYSTGIKIRLLPEA